MKEKILVVEDDHATARLVRDCLTFKGYKAEISDRAEEALERIKKDPPDLLILDVQLGAISGFQLCELLKKDAATAFIPIIMLTSMAAESHKITGFRLGADDYVTKPFSKKELAARVEAVLRRTTNHLGIPDKTLTAGGISINPTSRETLTNGNLVELTRIEFDLLAILLHRQGLVHSYQSLADMVWGSDKIATSHTISVTVSRLKQKLGKCGECISSIPGIGYKLTD